MALDMDPERRRRLMELARWREEWQTKYGIDDVEFIPDDAPVTPDVRFPTAEQEWEYVRRAREILGLDPETGRYLG
ncbi:MAG: hypothetical protein J2P15_23550 [Micromonosporaceae bacterium]|nr:hypothetical protein [Micromonosporaceae bacterium]